MSCEFQQGLVYALVGASGSGKTTFLPLLAGLDVPTSGDIELDGESNEPRRLPPESCVGYLPEFQPVPAPDRMAQNAVPLRFQLAQNGPFSSHRRRVVFCTLLRCWIILWSSSRKTGKCVV